MKPNKKDNISKDVPKAPVEAAAQAPLWLPSWRWHAQVLAGVYAVLIVAYFAVSAFLNRVPAPYHLREIPKEITPWMNK